MPPFAPMDPAVLTRQEWTDTMLSWTCPAGADESYAKLWSDLLYLCDLLGNHPAMVENNKQTYNTPATSKNKVYFMWDFMTRTMWMLAAIPAGRITSQTRSTWQDILGRIAMGQMLIDNPERLEAMNRSAGYDHDQGVEFGDEVKRAAAGITG